jgi:hypothetical protein
LTINLRIVSLLSVGALSVAYDSRPAANSSPRFPGAHLTAARTFDQLS